MSTQPPVVSIVIGSYNQKSILEKVLANYELQSMQDPFEVIIVDSSSSDGTGDFLTGYTPTNTNFQLRPIIQANEGKAAARNKGVDVANSGLIIISDSDMIPDAQFVETHVEAHRNHPGKPVCYEGVTYNMTHLHWPPNIVDTYAYIQSNYADGKRLGWYYFLTGNLSFPKTLFEEAGGFDESFQSYGWEDLDLGYRLIQKDKVSLHYLKNAKNYHYHVLTRDEEITRHYAKGKSAQRMLAKHPKLKTFLGINPVTKLAHAWMSESGWFHRKMQLWYKGSKKRKQNIGYYMLKEFQYLKGLLG
ncbi:glycosyltransferase [bacterium]|jgi:glycosyltransferase involved in cell wall biosynthesis|nr:glycosyltransferase [bacterium]